MAKRYIRINWKNSPSTSTPVNEPNLNQMDKGIKDCDDAIGDLALLKTTAKADLVAAINEQNENLGNIKIDRGSLTKQPGGNVVYIPFTKPFTVRPALLVSVRSGTGNIVATVEVNASTPTKGINAYLGGSDYNASNAYNIDWVAIGY